MKESKDLLLVEIITPEGIFYNKMAHMIVMPGIKGEFGVMRGHIPLLVQLQPGLVTIYENKEQERISIADGYVEITEDKVIMLVEKASNS